LIISEPYYESTQPKSGCCIYSFDHLTIQHLNEGMNPIILSPEKENKKYYEKDTMDLLSCVVTTACKKEIHINQIQAITRRSH
jgi:hypothetical protein